MMYLTRKSSRFSTCCFSVIVGSILFFSAKVYGGSILFVDDDSQPSGDGTSWDTAYRFLQDALATADGGGISEIRIAQGTYKPDRDEANPKGTGDREATFQLINGVAIMGGYAGIGAKDPDARDVEIYETILSGEIANPEDPDDNIAHVLTARDVNSGTILDGVSVTKGSAYINELPLEQAVGGGLYIISGNPIIRTVTFHDNRAPAGQSFAGGRGAGAHIEEGNPVFEDCDFVSNYAEEGGAGLSSFGNPTLISCTFLNNFNDANNSSTGGAFQTEAGTAVLINCSFIENSSDSKAGGLRSEETDLFLVRCSFINNTSGGSGSPGADVRLGSAVIVGCEFIGNIGNSGGSAGGGLFLESQGALVINCLFQDNIASTGGAVLTQANVNFINCNFDSNIGDDGGAIATFGWVVEITNSVFFNNYGDDRGGAIYAQSNPLKLINCVFVNNSSPGLGDGVWIRSEEAVFKNCILWGNGAATEASQIFIDEFASATVDYSAIQGLTGNLGGVGNIGEDPMFVDQNGGDLHLLPSSPCIDASNNTIVLNCVLDLDGRERFYDDPDTQDTGFGDAPIVDMGAFEFASPLSNEDCNHNGLIDTCEIGDGYSPDCNLNNIPDECDIANDFSLDCNLNGMPDECEVAALDCNGNGIPDDCDIASGTSLDCNRNDIPDECDLDSGFSQDCNLNGIPDDCETDCNGNGIPDDCDISGGHSSDSNNNGIPDECEAIHNSTQDTYYDTIQLAIEEAVDGDVIAVGPGTYEELIDFSGRAITLRSIEGPEVTILDGNGFGPIVTCQSGEEQDTVLDGFKIVNGFAPNGGGMLNFQSSPTIINCIFKNNSSDFGKDSYDGKGGAIFNFGESSPIIINCTFLQNFAIQGGAIFNDEQCHTVTVDCTFNSNQAIGNSNGGGVAGAIFNENNAPLIENCIFENNTSTGIFFNNENIGGGAIFSYLCYGIITDCTFIGNQTDRSGGATCDQRSKIDFINCLFKDNSAGIHGGAIMMFKAGDTARYVNCLFSDNVAIESGGALSDSSDSNYKLLNCTIANNQAQSGGGVFHVDGVPTYRNSIIWNNTSTDGMDLVSVVDTPNTAFSNVHNGPSGFGNIDIDPLFADIETGDYSLSLGSASIDAGDPFFTTYISETDLDGNDRILACRVDLGSFESSLMGSDCNSNGQSDGCDLLMGQSIDCNQNGIPDQCDISSGFSLDCNGNDIPDECDVAPVFVVDSGPLSPIGQGSPQLFVLESPPEAHDDVTLRLFASADVESGNEVITLTINGVWIGQYFESDTAACDPIPGEVSAVVSASVFNDAVNGQDANIMFQTTSTVDASACNGESYIRIQMEYATMPASDDCDANGIPDECDLLTSDCNENGIPDFCDINIGLPIVLNDTSGELSPIGFNSPQSHTLSQSPEAIGDVTLSFEAFADLSSTIEVIDVDINGIPIGTIFTDKSADCMVPPDMDQLVITSVEFNEAVAGGDAVITMIASNAVSPTACNGDNFISVSIEYQYIELSLDENGDGIPDECQPPGDLNGDGVVGTADLLILLSNWGLCDDCEDCQADFNEDCTVGTADLLFLFANWG